MTTSTQTADYKLRIALAYGKTIVSEAMCSNGHAITVGHADDNTFVLPTESSTPKRLGRQILARGIDVNLLDGFGGRLHQNGGALDIDQLRSAGHTTVRLAPEDWVVLDMDGLPGVRLVVQRVRGERLPPLGSRGDLAPLILTTILAALAFGILLVVSFLNYDPNAPELTLEDIDPRMQRAMFNYPPDDPPEEEIEVSEDPKDDRQRKKAGGEEGKFGDPNKTGRSNVPRLADPNLVKEGKVGLVKELLAQESEMTDLLGVGEQISGFDNGELLIGGGNYGLSTKGGGQGGGGEGEGMFMGTGDVNLGGDGVSRRKRNVKGTGKPKEKKVSVKPGRARVKGQLSKELIDREVRRHKAQIRFCYNKQLTRFPNLTGKVSLFWVIAMDGSVRGAKVRKSSLGNKDAESCMVRALSSWRFPKPEGGVVEVEYPFIFAPK